MTTKNAVGNSLTGSTGSGSFVGATSPTLVTPVLGTPSSGTLSSCTGLSLTTGVSGILPLANGGNGVSSAPNFRATMSGDQSLTTATAAKVAFDTKTFDVGTYYDTTNKRYTPLVAGKYLIMCQISFETVATVESLILTIYKNGSTYSIARYGMVFGYNPGIFGFYTTELMAFNGSTDYVEIYAEQQGGVTKPVYSAFSFFSGVFVCP